MWRGVIPTKEASPLRGSSKFNQRSRCNLYSTTACSCMSFPIEVLLSLYKSFREQARTQILEFKSQESELDSESKDFRQRDTSHEDAYKQWHKKYGASARELGHSRSIAVDAASKMREYLWPMLVECWSRTVNMSSKERQNILHETLKAARLQVEQSKEKEKVGMFAVHH